MSVCLKRKPLDMFVLLFVLCLEGNDAIKGTKQTGVTMPEDPTLNEDSKVFQITTQCIMSTAIHQLFEFVWIVIPVFCAYLPQSCFKKPVLKHINAELLNYYYLRYSKWNHSES